MAANKQSLADRLATGEESAFAELYDACADPLHGFLLSLLRDADCAAEVLQATFVRAVQNRKRFARVENPAAYLFQMARNEALRTGLKEKQRPGLTMPKDVEEKYRTASTALDETEMAAAALTKLNVDDREIVELKIYAGLTFQEIAAVTGQPPATVATRYRRALESLRPWLERQLR
jgi:RNA polymerase sigma-70 factor (ECF subfamily)